MISGDAPVIRLKEVCKYFDGSPVAALSNLTADIPGGRIVGLVGPDAAGKTTLMRLLAGLLLPSSGEIDVLGQTPGKMTTTPSSTNQTNAPSIGYMPQRFGLYEDLSVKDNLELHAELRGLRGEERETTFERLLGFTGLQPFTGRLAGKLSGGMKQKLGLACALLTRPRLLLLDEPGVGVDPLSRRELWNMVGDLIDDGVSVLWSTAYMDEAEQCAYVLMLDQGNLVYAGEPATFTARVNGRVFTLTPPAGEARTMLATWQQREDVRDALIQGSRIRLVLESAKPRQKDAVTPILPRLEDAYIDAVGGMDRRPSPFEPASTNKLSEKNDLPLGAVIQAIHLTKQFGDFVAARDISFEVFPGQIFGLLGPNGAGKSTTFRMLCGLSRPTRGECFVAGMNLLTAGGAARSQLGYMAQKCSLYGELTVRQNMRLIADLYGLSHTIRAARIEEMIESLDLTAYRDTRLIQLPLGHKQRLGMACATLHRPPVLFLDEPTSGVDPRTRREFWKHINAMTRSGVAVLVTTHFMEEAEYCDEIALIFQGAMIAKGTPDDLKADAIPHDSESGQSLPTLENAFIAKIEAVRQKTENDA